MTTEIVLRPKKEALALERRPWVKMQLQGIILFGSMTTLSRRRGRQNRAGINSACSICGVVRSLWFSGGVCRRGTRHCWGP